MVHDIWRLHGMCTCCTADEIDAIGKARGSSGDSGSMEREQGLLQLLTEMDGFKRDDRVLPYPPPSRILGQIHWEHPGLRKLGQAQRGLWVSLPRDGTLSAASSRCTLTSM